jgi:serine/threonine protein kinase/WD40 repeat protein
MSTDRWQLLSEWHNAWLVAGADERDSLRRQFVEGHPDLAVQADALASASAGLPGFLETPALTLVACELVQDDPLLDVETLVGPYRIVGLIARGGMGDVYRATDVRLQRDVALKLLAHAGTDDTQRIERFLQEARVTAALDHPNIVKVFDVGVLDGRPYLVAELLDGETLRVRLGHGPLAAAEARKIAGEVAAGLVVAHAAGLVHRDLKPDNIFLTRSGVTKILDFGIAKLTDAPAVADGLATLTGVLLGTAGYLSPEQIRGDAVDGRTDLFALGSMLFEMSTGQRAFAREHTIDTLHAILHDEPPNLLQAAGVSPDLTAIVMRLLEKAPAARFQSAADLEWALVHIARTLAAPSVPQTSARSLVTARRPRLGWIVAAALILTLSGTMLLNRRDVAPAAPEHVEFPILPPEGSSLTNLAVDFNVSPDGRHVAFIANSKAGSSLCVRSLAAVDVRQIRGTDGARNPFWSADSQSIGFFVGNQLKTVKASGGAAVVPLPWSVSMPENWESLGMAPAGTWNSQDIVVFGPSSDGNLYQIDVKRGGMATPVTAPVTTRQTSLHRRPSFLPDGQRFLYVGGLGTKNELRVGSLTTPDTVVIGTFESPVAYGAGHVFFTRGGNVMAQSFNEETLRLEGDPVPLRAQLRTDMPGNRGFSVSTNGRLVFLLAPKTEPQLTWVDRTGRPVGVVGAPGFSGGNLDVSPDGQQLAFSKPGNAAERQNDIWLIELATGRATPLTNDTAGDYDPTWSPDGKSIVFNSSRLGGSSLFLRASDGTGVDVPLAKFEQSESNRFTVASWSRADVLIFNVLNKNGDMDLWTLSMSGDRTRKAFVSSKQSELNGTFSPDGRWVAYQSNASGRYEIVVRPFPDKDPARTISRDGGRYPRWRGDGKELFFVSPAGTMMAAGFDPTNGVSQGLPQPLFATQIRVADNRPYAVDKDGQRFLLKVGPDPQMVAVMDWRTLLDR